MSTKCRLFISYSFADQDRVASLGRKLLDQGIDTFWAQRTTDTLLVDDTLPDALKSEMKKATHILVYLSNNTKKSKWVRREISFMDQLKQNVKFIRYESVPDLTVEDIPLELINLKRIQGYNNKKHISDIMTAIGVTPNQPPTTSPRINSYQETLNPVLAPKTVIVGSGGNEYEIRECWQCDNNTELWQANDRGRNSFVVLLILFYDQMNAAEISKAKVFLSVNQKRARNTDPISPIRVVDAFRYSRNEHKRHAMVAVAIYERHLSMDLYYRAMLL